MIYNISNFFRLNYKGLNMPPITSSKLLSALAIFFITLFAGTYPFIKKENYTEKTSLKGLKIPLK